jgi:Protein of unknown function (DUF1579)
MKRKLTWSSHQTGQAQSLQRAILFLLVVAIAFPALTQDEPDDPKHVFQDPLLDNMVGNWKLTGKIMQRNVEHSVEAEWVLNHQFLRLHEKQTAPPKEAEVPYEAMVMIGYDNASDCYVAHWLDV